MAGVPSTDTFRLYGLINHARMTILVDSGSTHNFVQPRVAKFLNLPVQDTLPLHVMVGNGSILDCQQIFPDATVLIQNHSFTVTLCVLPLSGADVVLGVEWLRTLGPIITDYTTFTMQFTHLGQPISLCTDVHIDTTLASAQQDKRMIATDLTSGLFHLSFLTTPQPDPPTEPPHPIPGINDLLLQFHSIFQTPSTLPPPLSPTRTPHQPPSLRQSCQCPTI